MTTDTHHTQAQIEDLGESATKNKDTLPPAAQRALAEAEERRRVAEKKEQENQKEIDGRQGPEPTRYGDWEKGGLAIDF